MEGGCGWHGAEYWRCEKDGFDRDVRWGEVSFRRKGEEVVLRLTFNWNRRRRRKMGVGRMDQVPSQEGIRKMHLIEIP